MLARSNIFAALVAVFLFLSSLAEAAYYARHRLTPAQYQNEFTSRWNMGWHLTYVSGYVWNNQQYYAAIWYDGPRNPQYAYHGLTSAQYQARFNQVTAQGFTPILVQGYHAPDGTDRYAAIFEQVSRGSPWVARHGMTSAGYQQEFNNWTGQGYRLKHVSGYSVWNRQQNRWEARYAALWDQSSGFGGWVARHGLTSDQYQAVFNEQTRNGYTLSVVSAYDVGNTDYYACIFERKPPSTWVARHRMNSGQYQNWFNTYNSQGYSLKAVTGYTWNNQDAYAAIWSQ